MVKEPSNGSTEQNKEPRNNHKYSQLTFDKGRKPMQWNKDSLLKMVLEQLDVHMQKNNNNNNLDPDLTSFTKINSIFKMQIYKASRK